MSILTAVAGCLVLAFFLFSAWQRGSVGEGLARAFSLALALAGTGAAIFFWNWGQHIRWRSDGPGALALMIALAGAAFVAFVFWGTLGGMLVWPALIGPERDDPSQDPAARRAALVGAVWTALTGLSLLAFATFVFRYVLPRTP